MKVAVTGGAGFIGHHLVRGLVAQGHQVSVIDDFSAGLRSRLLPFEGRIAVTEGSILDHASLDRAFDGAEVVLHEAAIASVVRSLAEPNETNRVNVAGTIEVMLAAARAGVRRVVFAGSSAVYGIPAALPCRETQCPDPVSPYGIDKLAAEHYVHALGAAHGVETAVLRYFNVFGPGQDPLSEYAAVVPRFATAVLEGRRPMVYGDGATSRDYVYVDNVVEANLLAARPSAPSGLTCNVASGQRFTLLDLLAAIADAAGLPAEPTFGPPRPGDIPHSQAEISVAQHALGYSVQIPFADGIARTVAWYRDSAVVADG